MGLMTEDLWIGRIGKMVVMHVNSAQRGMVREWGRQVVGPNVPGGEAGGCCSAVNGREALFITTIQPSPYLNAVSQVQKPHP